MRRILAGHFPKLFHTALAHYIQFFLVLEQD